MARITVHVSDLTGQEITEDEQVAHLVVEHHPNFDEPITLEAKPEEIDLDAIHAQDFVVLSYYAPGDRNPQPLFLHLDDFNDLFKQESLTPDEALERARTAQAEERPTTRRRGGRRGGSRQGGQTRERIDYSSPEHAGEPHPGRITDAEKAYVRDHLDEVNERLRTQGRREIDPNDPMMAERYGLETPPVTRHDDATIEEIERAPEA